MYMVVKFMPYINLVAHIGVHDCQDVDQRASQAVALFPIRQRSNIKDHILNIPAIFRNFHWPASGVVFHNVNALHGCLMAKWYIKWLEMKLLKAV